MGKPGKFETYKEEYPWKGMALTPTRKKGEQNKEKLRALFWIERRRLQDNGVFKIRAWACNRHLIMVKPANMLLGGL